MIGEYDGTAGEWLWQEIPMNRGEGMLEHIALDTNDLDDDQNTTEYRQYAVQTDFQETVWGLSDTSGGQVERYFYSDPYGVSSTEDASGTGIGEYATEVYHQKRLHGGVVDAGADLFDFRNRWMKPGEGAWLSRDPVGEVLESQNSYQTFLASPLVRVDRFGLSSHEPCTSEYDLKWGGSNGGMHVCVQVTTEIVTCNGEETPGCTRCEANSYPDNDGIDGEATGYIDCTVRINCDQAVAAGKHCGDVIEHERNHIKNYRKCGAKCGRLASTATPDPFKECVKKCMCRIDAEYHDLYCVKKEVKRDPPPLPPGSPKRF